MPRRSSKFFWKLFLGNAVLLVGVVGISSWMIAGAFDRFVERDLTDYLKNYAELLKYQIEQGSLATNAQQLDVLAKATGSVGPDGVRVTIVSSDGVVWGDSDADPTTMESHSGRVEIRQALAGGYGESTRWSMTVSRELKYVAVRLGSDDAPLGVVRVAMAVKGIVAHTRESRPLIWKIGLMVAVAALVLAMGLARIWADRVSRITRSARKLAKGDLSTPIEMRGNDEVALLARSLNRMRMKLSNQLVTIEGQRRTLAALMSQLGEGVVVADASGRIVLMNPQATKLLNLDLDTTDDGRPVHEHRVEEVIRQHELQNLLLMTRDDVQAEESRRGFLEARVRVEHSGGVFMLLARASNIVMPSAVLSVDSALPRSSDPSPHDADRRGRLLVLTDITELDHAMQVKSDFVANASHELRTPLSAIRAAVETFMTLDLSTEAQTAMRLVDVVGRQGGRLEQMVSDLLDLSIVESGKDTFATEPLVGTDIISEIRAKFDDRLRQGEVEWWDNGPQGVAVNVNPRLLHLVLDNLIDNAIKFTTAGGRVGLTVEICGAAVQWCVEDTGCGIAEAEQDRVFERFYQVARARSGVDRGTGLGLSIVRHAVKAMGGTIELQSVVGKGTTIRVNLPVEPVG